MSVLEKRGPCNNGTTLYHLNQNYMCWSNYVQLSCDHQQGHLLFMHFCVSEISLQLNQVVCTSIYHSSLGAFSSIFRLRVWKFVAICSHLFGHLHYQYLWHDINKNINISSALSWAEQHSYHRQLTDTMGFPMESTQYPIRSATQCNINGVLVNPHMTHREHKTGHRPISQRVYALIIEILWKFSSL